MMNEAQFNKLFDKAVKDQYYYGAKVDLAHHIYWEWSEGGASGGSCWDTGGGARPFYGDNPPDTTPLDSFLEKNFPALPFFKYKEILTKVVEDRRSDYEYYGNYEDFSTRHISRKVLLEVLKEAKCISS